MIETMGKWKDLKRLEMVISSQFSFLPLPTSAVVLADEH